MATAVLIYKIAFRLTGRKFAGVVAAGVFAVNVNMLYMQSTPMTEALLFCMLAAMVYCIQQWADTDRYQYLIAGAVAAVCGTLTRYESWPILACLVIAVVFIAWQRTHRGRTPKIRWASTQDRFIVFGVVASAGIAAWLIWNWAIFGNPLDFQGGAFAKPSNWVSSGEPFIGHWLIAAKTYWYAMVDNEPSPLLLLAAGGLVCLIAREWRTKRTAARSLPVLSLLVIVPFIPASPYTGQRPLHVLQISSDLYNVRFGLIMLVPTAILIGYLVGTLQRVRPADVYRGRFGAGHRGRAWHHPGTALQRDYVHGGTGNPVFDDGNPHRSRSSPSSGRTTPAAWCSWSRSETRTLPFRSHLIS